MQSIQDWFTDFVTGPEFLPAYPYYAAVLARMQAVEDPYVPVMAVSAHGKHVWLHVNAGSVMKPENIKFIKGVLLHEVHHVVLGHLTDPAYDSPAHADLMELAMEVSANEYVREPLPGDPPVWLKYKEYGLSSGQSTMERYELLVKARKAGANVPVPFRWLDSHLIRGVGRCRLPGQRPDPSQYVREKRLVSDASRNRSEIGLGKGADRAARSQAAIRGTSSRNSMKYPPPQLTGWTGRPHCGCSQRRRSEP